MKSKEILPEEERQAMWDIVINHYPEALHSHILVSLRKHREALAAAEEYGEARDKEIEELNQKQIDFTEWVGINAHVHGWNYPLTHIYNGRYCTLEDLYKIYNDHKKYLQKKNKPTIQ